MPTWRSCGTCRPAFIVAVLVGALAGCVTPEPGEAAEKAPRLVCIVPCERLVDGSPERAFEPDIAIDPRDDRHWFVGSTVFHDSDEAGTPLYLKAHVTFDAGATWHTMAFPGPVPAGHPMAAYTHGADPAVTILDDGTVVYAGMFGTGVLHPAGADGVSTARPFDIVVARSGDGGRTFSEFVVVAEGVGVMGRPPASPFPGIFLAGEWPDQPWLAAGPDGRILLGYHLRSAQGGPHVFAAMTSVSSDSGRTWSEPTPVREGGSFGNVRPHVRDDGTFWITYRDVSVEPRPVWSATSADGVTWESTLVPDVRTGWMHDSDADGDHLWITLVPGAEGGNETIQVLRSDDGGVSWEAIDVDHAEAEGFSMPRIAAGPAGAMVTYYLARADGTTEYRAAFVTPTGTVTRVTLNESAISNNHFVGGGWAKFGDYVGLDATEAGAAAAWVSGDGSDADVRAAFLRWPDS